MVNEVYESIDTYGCFSPDQAEYYFNIINDLPDGSIFVEVGCFLGKSSIFAAKTIERLNKSIDLQCIDSWSDISDQKPVMDMIEQYGDLYNKFIENIELYKVDKLIRPIKADSVEATSCFKDGTVDFVFIDADHNYHGVKRDIIAWLPKVKTGGILAGHDYGSSFPGVRTAVNELLSGNNLIAPVKTSYPRRRCWEYRVC